MKKLFVFLDELEKDQTKCLLVDENENKLFAIDNTQTIDKFDSSEYIETIILINPKKIILTDVMLPAMNKSKLYEAIPYALEETLAAELEDLHFAIADLKARPIRVATISSLTMEKILNQLKDWKLKPNIMTSSFYALPNDKDCWRIVIFGNQVYARLSENEGFVCEIDDLYDYLIIANYNEKNHRIKINEYNEKASSLSLANIEHNIFPAENFYSDLANHFDARKNINLLQGKFAIKKVDQIDKKKQVKIAMIVGSIWLLMLFLYPSISYFLLSKEVRNTQKEILMLYSKHFPQSVQVVAPKLRMEEKIRKLSAHANHSHFLFLLGNISLADNDEHSIKLKRIDFQNDSLTIEVIANDVDSFNAFIDRLSSKKLSVKQQSANMIGEKINAVLQLS